jgi:hypothetical protein
MNRKRTFDQLLEVISLEGDDLARLPQEANDYVSRNAKRQRTEETEKSTEEEIEQAMMTWRAHIEDDLHIYSIDTTHTCWSSGQIKELLLDFFGCEGCGRTHWCRFRTEPQHCVLVPCHNNAEYVCIFSKEVVTASDPELGSYRNEIEAQGRQKVSNDTVLEEPESVSWIHTSSAVSQRRHANVMGDERLRKQKLKQADNTEALVRGGNEIRKYERAVKKREKKRLTIPDLPEMTDEMQVPKKQNNEEDEIEREKEMELERAIEISDRMQIETDGGGGGGFGGGGDQGGMDLDAYRSDAYFEVNGTAHSTRLMTYTEEEQQRDREFITRYLAPLASMMKRLGPILKPLLDSSPPASLESEFENLGDFGDFGMIVTSVKPMVMRHADPMDITESSTHSSPSNNGTVLSSLSSSSSSSTFSSSSDHHLRQFTAQMVRIIDSIAPGLVKENRRGIIQDLTQREIYYGQVVVNLVHLLSLAEGQNVVSSAHEAHRYVAMLMLDVFVRAYHDQDSFGIPILVWAADPWLSACADAGVMKILIELIMDSGEVSHSKGKKKKKKKAGRKAMKMRDYKANGSTSEITSSNTNRFYDEERVQKALNDLSVYFKQTIINTWTNITHYGNRIRSQLRASSLRPLALYAGMMIYKHHSI